ncbi:MAG: transporter ATP-binding protein [Rhizobium sp.]|nr:transporter ATP-binding protein [Rhizobium sp.]
MAIESVDVSPAINLKNVSFGYDRHPAVHHLSGSFVDGSMTAILGPNGAGKSTLLKGIAGILAPLTGHIEMNGFKRSGIAYLPQLAEIDRSFPITVLDLVSLGLWRKIGAFRRIGGGHMAQARIALEAVGLEGFEPKIIGALSSGQFQRVLFARLLLQDSPMILLDEPFSAIDTKTTTDLLELVSRWHGEGRTILVALHDLDQVRKYFSETLVLARETMAWGKTEDVLTADVLLRARQTCEAWDEQAELCEREG